LPYNAPHAPLHAKASDVARNAGRYDVGWDAVRTTRFKNQVAMGLVPSDMRLPERSAGVPDWAAVPDEQRKVYARYMELYAALIDNLDQNLGRITRFLAETGQLDNTLIIITSGNGANVPSSANKHTVERLTLTADRLRLRYEITVEDAEFLATPGTLTQQWDHRPDLEFSPASEACSDEAAARYKPHVPQ
jgi:arylsulfatase A-like enzyme